MAEEKKQIEEKKEKEIKDMFESSEKPLTRKDLEPIMPFLYALRGIRQSVDAVPTNEPQSFLQQIVFYENGGTRRLYLHIAGSWVYVTLT
jgi:hypothetical protein